MTKTHWKKTIDKDWIGCYILPDSGNPDNGSSNSNPYLPIQVKLLRVEFKEVEVKGIKGKYKIAYFDKNPYFNKPMLLSASANLKEIAKITKSNFIEDWGNINKHVILEAKWDKAFGSGKDWALRITEIKGKPILIEDSQEWNSIVEFLKEGGDISKAIGKYSISKELLEKLKNGK